MEPNSPESLLCSFQSLLTIVCEVKVAFLELGFRKNSFRIGLETKSDSQIPRWDQEKKMWERWEFGSCPSESPNIKPCFLKKIS
jgi:hypothetical protein